MKDRDEEVRAVIVEARNVAAVEVRDWHAGRQLELPVTLAANSVGK